MASSRIGMHDIFIMFSKSRAFHAWSVGLCLSLHGALLQLPTYRPFISLHCFNLLGVSWTDEAFCSCLTCSHPSNTNYFAYPSS